MIYKIKVYYKTGSSFGSNDEIDYVDLGWENIEIVKENMKRIKEHYRWYEDFNNHYKFSPKQNIEKPVWLKSIDDELAQYIIMLKLDDGTERQYSPFWVGYFEQLYEIELCTDYKYEF